MSNSPPFTPKRSLLNSKFEGYKLAPLSQSDAVISYLLPRLGATQATVSGRSQLSFKEVQHRIRFNHLTLGQDGRTVGYIDREGFVVLVTFEQASFEPHFHSVFEVPQSIHSELSVSPEYPRLVALDATRWIVSDGAGLLYLIDVIQGPDGALSGNLLSSHEVNESLFDSVPADGQPSLPFRLHSAHITESGDILVLISTKAPNTSPSPTLLQTKLKPTQAQFFLSALLIRSLDAVQSTSCLWSLRSDDLPSYVSYDAKSQEFTILAESQYIGRDDSRILPLADPRPDEIAPIPRAGENLDIVGDIANSKPGIKHPPPYSWTQSSDSLTIVFFLPSSTPKSALHVNLAARSLTVLVDDPPPSSVTLHPIPIPKYALKKFWDGIDSSASFWTWEKDGDSISSPNNSGRTHTVGVLTLHLEKQHDGTKWPHIFASTEGGHHDDDVPETLDPSELYAIRESLEKYTAALADGSDASGLGLGSGLPSLAQGEMDDEVDAKVGVPAVLTFINAQDGECHGNGWPFDVLSFPLPTITDSPRVLIIRNDIDGLVYAPDDNHGWKHTSTFPALSFVLASKRDTRFVFHHASDAVFAFESGGSTSGGGNMYVYRNARGQKWAQQAVLKVGGGGAGTLLGVVGVKDADGGVGIVCLCDKEMQVLKGVA